MFRLSNVSIVLVAACGAGDGLGGRPGDFGQVTATPECGALSQACIGQGLDAPLALGSTVDVFVEYKVPGSSGPPTVLASANQEVITTPSKTQLSAVGEGLSAVMFVGPAGEVIDLVHVFVQRTDELRINRYDSSGDLLGQVQPRSQLLVGDEILIAVEPFANGQPLLGNFVVSYQSSNAGSVAIVPDPVGGWYRVVARTPGQATITFEAFGNVITWQIEVLS